MLLTKASARAPSRLGVAMAWTDISAGTLLARQVTASLAGLLAERNMSRRDLAKCMGVSPGRVSQILSGDENLTLHSLANIAEALSARVEVQFYDPPRAAQSGSAEQHAPEGPVRPYVPAPR
ncbi:helix-turn-helix domain-containing protein [Streptomyces sp. NPDC017529]|uniref:helix-turn-helix domain-containing protein n=1 Tax=Streptomyces sp. NPDC017529 TaxID=3365000 RepID=UPI0037983554